MMAGSVITRNKEDAKLLANDLKEHDFVFERGIGESTAYEGVSRLKLSIIEYILTETALSRSC